MHRCSWCGCRNPLLFRKVLPHRCPEEWGETLGWGMIGPCITLLKFHSNLTAALDNFLRKSIIHRSPSHEKTGALGERWGGATLRSMIWVYLNARGAHAHGPVVD